MDNYTVNKGIIEYLLSLNIAKNRYEIFACGYLLNNYTTNNQNVGIPMSKSFLERIYTPHGYRKTKDKPLLKFLFEKTKEFDKRLNQSNEYSFKRDLILELTKWINKYPKDIIVRLQGNKIAIRCDKENFIILDTNLKETCLEKYQKVEFINSILKYMETLDVDRGRGGKEEHPTLIDTKSIRDFYENYILKDKLSDFLLTRHGLSVAMISRINANGIDKQEYVESLSGRLFSDGNYYSLQNIKSVFRELVFNGQWELDINTAAPSIMYQIYLRRGYKKLPYVEDYISNKEYWRDKVTATLDIPKRLTKELLTASIFGANYKVEGKSFSNLLTVDKLEILKNDIELSSLFSEMVEVPKSIAKNYDFNSVTNAYGKTRKFKKGESGRAATHIYFGVERIILEILRKELREYSLLLHDAIVTPIKPDVSKLEEIVEKKTGFKVSFSLIEYNKVNFYNWMEEYDNREFD